MDGSVDDMVVADYVAGVPVNTIRERHRLGYETVYRILDERGVPRRDSSRRRASRVDADAVVAEYQGGAPVHSILHRHELGWTALYRLLDERGVDRRAPQQGERTSIRVRGAIAEAYERGEPVKAIAERFGVSSSTVSNVGRQVAQQRQVTDAAQLVELIVGWCLGTALGASELDSIARVGVDVRRVGLSALDGVDGELREAAWVALNDRLRRRWGMTEPPAG